MLLQSFATVAEVKYKELTVTRASSFAITAHPPVGPLPWAGLQLHLGVDRRMIIHKWNEQLELHFQNYQGWPARIWGLDKSHRIEPVALTDCLLTLCL